MLNNLKKMINAEAESDLQVDLMLEAVDDSIADMFIEDDGEIEMAENEIMKVLEKIPAYDEEEAMNKKLARIAESYIPEEFPRNGIINEGMMSGKFKQMSNSQLRAKIKELEDAGNHVEAGKYKRELEKRGQQE